MRQRHRAGIHIASALALSVLVPVSAPAQEDAAVGEVIVTARRLEERLQDVPISIQVLNQKDLNNRNIASGTDLAQYIPSLSVDIGTYGRDNASFSLRGFTQTGGTTASVAVYFADVVSPRGSNSGTVSGDGAPAGNFFDLQNVQVLQGPQGTLFGRNTTGGAVLLVPNKPTSKFEGYAELSYGNYDMRRLQGVLNLPFSDNVRFRLGVNRELRDGYIDNDSGIGPPHFENSDYVTVRGSMVVDVTENLENYTIATYNRSQNNGPLPQLFICNPSVALFSTLACPQVAAHSGEGFYTAQNDYNNPTSLNKTWQVINTTTWRATDTLTVKNIFGYGEIKNYLASSLFGTDWSIPAGVPGIGGLPVQFVTSTPPPAEASNAESTLSEEFQLQGRTADSRLIWQAGGYYEKSAPLGYSGSQNPNLLSCTNSATLQCIDAVGALIGAEGFVGGVGFKHGTNRYRNLATYGQATYTITDQLKATAGVRYTSDTADALEQQFTYRFPTANNPVAQCISIFTTLAANCIQNFHEKSNAPTWVVDLEYNPIEDAMLYGKWSRGYRQGAIAGTSADGYQAFGPEHVDTYEVGEKTTFHSVVNGMFNVAAFYNDFRDQQLEVGFVGKPGVSSAAGITNAGRSRIWGIEAEAAVSPIPSVTFSGSYTYLNTLIVQITPTVLAPNSAYLAAESLLTPGEPLPGAPKNKATLTGTYNLPLPDTLGKLSTSLTATYTGKIFETTGTFGTNPCVSLLNLNVNWESIATKPVDVEFFVTNLTDKRYIVAYTSFYDSLGWEARTLGTPRMYGARFRVHFGS
jgi:iron complex outermembrane recepter protein